jgi:hypothetical protein
MAVQGRGSRPWRAAKFILLLGVPLALFAIFIGASETFQACIHGEKNLPVYGGLRHLNWLPYKIFLRVRLHSVCAVRTESAWDSFSTLAVALFTLALWLSTEKLWRSAETERRANDLARQTESQRFEATLATATDANNAATAAAHAAIRQASAAEQTFVATTRPWLKITNAVAEKIVIASEQVTIWLTFECTAVGGSPATAFSVHAEILDPSQPAFAHIETRRMIQNILLIENVMGDAIFPGDTVPFQLQIYRSTEEFLLERDRRLAQHQSLHSEHIPEEKKELFAAKTQDALSYFAFDIVGCVYYRFYGSDETHVTTFAGTIRRPDVVQEDGKIVGVFKVDKAATYSADAIKLFPQIFGVIAT